GVRIPVGTPMYVLVSAISPADMVKGHGTKERPGPGLGSGRPTRVRALPEDGMRDKNASEENRGTDCCYVSRGAPSGPAMAPGSPPVPSFRTPAPASPPYTPNGLYTRGIVKLYSVTRFRYTTNRILYPKQ